MIKIINAKDFSYIHANEKSRDVSSVIREIIEDVKADGDEAVIEAEILPGLNGR